MPHGLRGLQPAPDDLCFINCNRNVLFGFLCCICHFGFGMNHVIWEREIHSHSKMDEVLWQTCVVSCRLWPEEAIEQQKILKIIANICIGLHVLFYWVNRWMTIITVVVVITIQRFNCNTHSSRTFANNDDDDHNQQFAVVAVVCWFQCSAEMTFGITFCVFRCVCGVCIVSHGRRFITLCAVNCIVKNNLLTCEIATALIRCQRVVTSEGEPKQKN